MHRTLIKRLLQSPVHAEVAAVRVILQSTPAAQGPPLTLFSSSRASHAQRTLVTGHTIWNSVPEKDIHVENTLSDQTERLTHHFSVQDNAKQQHCDILKDVSNILTPSFGYKMGTEHRKHLLV